MHKQLQHAFPIFIFRKSLLPITALMFAFMNTHAQQVDYVLDNSLQVLQLEQGPAVFKVADINNDGFNDVVMVGDHGSPLINSEEYGITCFLGDGTGSNWTVVQEGSFGYGGVSIADVNNDGFLDVAYGVHHAYNTSGLGNQYLEVALGNGSASGWVAYDSGLAQEGQEWGMFGTDLADIDNDGLLDLGAAAFGCCDGMHIYKNNGDGTWTHKFGALGGNSYHLFEFADFNNDGNMDFAVAWEALSAYFGDGTGNFTNKDDGLPLGQFIAFDYISTANVDSDAAQEFAFVSQGGLFVYKWNEAMQTWENKSGTLPSTGGFYAVQLADLNNDGNMDIAASTFTDVYAFLGDGQYNWTQADQITIPGMNYPYGMTTGDLNMDGKPEIILLGQVPSDVPFGPSINKFFILKDSFEVQATGSINALAPAGNPCIVNGNPLEIQWGTATTGITTPKVNLAYSVSGIAGAYLPIISQIENTGNYSWNVPAAPLSSEDCYIRYVLTNDDGTVFYDTAYSDVFSIGTCDTTTAIAPITLSKDEMIVFPNPAQKSVTLRYAGNRKFYGETFIIADYTGRTKMLVTTGTNATYTFSLANLASGNYLIMDNKGKLKGRLVKE